MLLDDIVKFDMLGSFSTFQGLHGLNSGVGWGGSDHKGASFIRQP